MSDWEPGEVRVLPLDAFGLRYRRYRLPDAEAETAMSRSLERYGQIAPLVVCLREETPEVIDGFKRLTAAQRLPALRGLSARLLAADERAAKAAIYGLNRGSRPVQQLEEAWVIHALVREDGLSQVETAELLGRDKSWVCRRLALVERLVEEARGDLGLGLLTPTAARALVQLPAGNQAEVLACTHRETLTTAELRGVVALIQGAANRPQVEHILAQPREALAQAQATGVRPQDPRLSAAGNRVARHLGQLLEQLARMESWLRHRGRAELTVPDRRLLAEGFGRLGRDAGVVAALAADLSEEVRLP
jgi:ParB-like chromosome segregation protein Spo0J